MTIFIIYRLLCFQVFSYFVIFLLFLPITGAERLLHFVSFTALIAFSDRHAPACLALVVGLASLTLASVTRFVNAPRLLTPPLLINKTSPLAVKTTFRGCFYPRAYDGLRFELQHTTKQKTSPKGGSVWWAL